MTKFTINYHFNGADTFDYDVTESQVVDALADLYGRNDARYRVFKDLYYKGYMVDLEDLFDKHYDELYDYFIDDAKYDLQKELEIKSISGD